MIESLFDSPQILYTVQTTDWVKDALNLSLIRRIVFIDEQRVPEELEWDEWDAVSFHVIAMSYKNEPIGTARLLPDGHIGRMAVLRQWRRRGVGTALLREILNEAEKRNFVQVALNAQVSAGKFYELLGFQKMGKEFMEAGIPHIKMILKL